MHAQCGEDGTITITGASRVEVFTRVWAGIGWPARESGYVCVLGQRSDGRYHALWEQTGGLWELGEAALWAKDTLLIESFWVDGTDTLATSYLRTLDGLCFHDNPCEITPHSLGALFQVLNNRDSQPDRPTATVRLMPERVVGNFRSALEKTRGAIMKGHILIHEANCPKLLYTIRQPLDHLVQSPVMKALVWVVTALQDATGHETTDKYVSGPWYTNFARDCF